MATSQYNVLTLQLLTPLALPVSEQEAPGAISTQNMDCVLLPWVTAQGIKDAVASIANYAQPSLMSVTVDGQLGALAPQGTITYTAATGAQTVTIGGVAVTPAPVVGATDSITAANVAAAINASLPHQLVATAVVLPAAPTVVVVMGKWPGPGLNTIAFAATAAGGTATVSAATLGGSAAGSARAGVASTQLNQLGIGTPLFP